MDDPGQERSREMADGWQPVTAGDSGDEGRTEAEIGGTGRLLAGSSGLSDYKKFLKR